MLFRSITFTTDPTLPGTAGVMQLGFIASKTISGDVQLAMGYQHFFLWVLVSAIPVLVLSRVVKINT